MKKEYIITACTTGTPRNTQVVIVKASSIEQAIKHARIMLVKRFNEVYLKKFGNTDYTYWIINCDMTVPSVESITETKKHF